MFALALVKSIEIIGEAASNVSLETRNEYRDISWTDIIGMRHRLVHGYSDVNFDTVWSTATDYLPPLIAALERILATEGNAGEPA